MDSSIDINTVLGTRAAITVTPEENDSDRVARLASEARWDRLALFKHYVLFVLTLVSIAAICGVCVHYLLFDHAATADSKRWAQTVLSSVFTGSISFVLGQMTSPKK